MKVSYDKWYPVVQPQAMVQQEAFIKKVEKQNAEHALQVQIDNTVKKFHQYEYEIYEYRMRQVTLNIQIANLKRDIDQLV
jgi:nitrogen fixation protein FixH